MTTNLTPGARGHDLDWLRVFAILAVFTYHSLHFFDPSDWSVKNLTTYPWVAWLMALVGLYMMPLIFILTQILAQKPGRAIAGLPFRVSCHAERA